MWRVWRAAWRMQRQRSLITTLEQQVQDKLDEMEHLRRQNDELRHRGSVLEVAVSGRDDQLRILSTLTGKASDGGEEQSNDTSGSSGRPDAALLSGSAVSGAASASNGAAAPLAAAAAAVAGAAAGAPPPRPLLPLGSSYSSSSGDGSVGGAGGAHASSRGGRDRSGHRRRDKRRWWRRDGAVTSDEIEGTTFDDLKALLKEYVSAASLELFALQREDERWWGDGDPGGFEHAGGGGGVGGGGPGWHGRNGGGGGGGGGSGSAGGGSGEVLESLLPGSAGSFWWFGHNRLPAGIAPGSARARIHLIVNRFAGALKHLMLVAPHRLVPFMGTNLETGQRVKAVPDSFWRGVVAQLGLTQQQRDDIIAFHEVHTRHMGSVMVERAQLQATLDSAHQAMAASPQDGPGAGAGSMATGAMAAAMEATEQLAANMQKEAAVRSLLFHYTFQAVFDAVQIAKMNVHSYPLIGDAVAITHVIWDDAGLKPPGTQPPKPTPAPAP